jgi:hypothetical protein
MDVYLRFGCVDEKGDVKWKAAQDWSDLPYPAFVAMQKILHAAEGEMLKLGEQAVQLKAKTPTGPVKA